MWLFTELVRSMLYIIMIMYIARNILTLDLKQSIGETVRGRWWFFTGYAVCLALSYSRNGGQALTVFLEYGGILMLMLLNYECERTMFAIQALFIYFFSLLLNGLSDNIVRAILVFLAGSDLYAGHEFLVQLIDSLIMLFSLICTDKLIWKHYSRSIRRFDLRHLLLMIGTIITDLFVVYVDWVLLEQKVMGIAPSVPQTINVTITVLLYIHLIQLITSGYLKNIYRERIHLAEYNLEEQKKYYMYLENRERETKKFRHDFREHLHMLQYLAETGNQSQLQDYLEQIGGKVDTFGGGAHLNCPIAEAVVNKYLAEAEDAGIRFTIHGYFPSECYIQAIDLCILLSNLLSNALEAVMLCKGKQMLMDVRHEPGEIYIYIENDCSAETKVRGQHPATTKMDRKSHGFGLENVEETVHANGGWIRMEAEEGKFHTFIELVNKKQEEKG